jgi:hypothetical protein
MTNTGPNFTSDLCDSTGTKNQKHYNQNNEKFRNAYIHLNTFLRYLFVTDLWGSLTTAPCKKFLFVESRADYLPGLIVI